MEGKIIRNIIQFHELLKKNEAEKIKEKLFTENELDFNKIIPNSNIKFCDKTYFDNNFLLAFNTEKELDETLLIKLFEEFHKILPKNVANEIIYSIEFVNYGFAKNYEYKNNSLVLVDEYSLYEI